MQGAFIGSLTKSRVLHEPVGLLPVGFSYE
jgi:hypothetical protein